MKCKKDDILLCDISRLWLKDISSKISETTYALYFSNVENHILPYFQNKKVVEIDREMIQNFINQKLGNGRLDHKGGLSVTTVKGLYHNIKDMLQYAKVLGYEMQDIGKIQFSQSQYKEFAILNKEQQKCLEQVVKNDGNIQKIGIIICLYTGIRIGEVCALKWEDVQFENAVLHIYKMAYRTKDFSKNNRKTKLIVKEPKSKHSVRYIPLGSTLLEYLKKYRQEDSYFVLTGNSEKPLDPRTYQNQFYSYLKKCNIKKMKFHILRHTFATRWIENNCDVKSLSEILGHSSVTITMNTYVHSNFELKQEGMKKLEENQEFLS